MSDRAKEMQGVDPKANVFANLYPMLYAAETPVSGGYEQQSMLTATIADQLCGGLHRRRVLDLGCGYGTTTMALARFCPGHITAIDNSEKMIELLKIVMLSDVDLEMYMRHRGAEEVLGDLFPVTLEHLKRRRAEFQQGIYHTAYGDRLDARVVSSLELQSALCDYDCVVGNNFLHWPVNQRKAVLKKDQPFRTDSEIIDLAIGDALRPIARTLKHGGVGVFLEPKDFITIDDDPDLERYCEAHTMVPHPVFFTFHRLLNRLLKENYGLDRAMPKTTGMFNVSRIEGYVKSAGFKLLRLTHVETVYNCDPVKAMYVRMPMLLGSLNLSFDDKINLGKQVMAKIDSMVTAADRAVPIQQQHFVICVQKE